MTALFVLALLAQTPVADTAVPPPAVPAMALDGDTLRPADGPIVLWNRHATPLVAIHLTVPLPGNLTVGGAELLQELVRPSAAATARAVGGELEIDVHAGRATFALTGPESAFDALVWILRDALREPDLSMARLREARVRAEDRVLAVLERPEPRLRALLRARLQGQTASGAALDAIAPEDVRTMAARLYQPDRLRVVVVGNVPPEVVLSAFAGWPAPGAPLPSGPPGPDATGAAPLPPPQTHNAWAGLAYPLDASPAVIAVAAELVSRRMREGTLVEGAAEAWVTPVGGVLAVLGGARRNDPEVAGAARVTAFPSAGDHGTEASGLARYLRRQVAEAAALAGPAGIAEAAATIRRSMLMDARTSGGRARLIAEWWGDASLGAPTVHNVLEALEAVQPHHVRAALTAALAAAPLVDEVRP